MSGEVLRIVLAADRPGHWYDNSDLLTRAAATLGWPRIAVAGPDLVTGRDGVQRSTQAWVCASHEAGVVGLAIRPAGPVGFDLCDSRRADSVRSALPLVLSPTEDELVGPSDLAGTGPARLWAAVEALAKLAGVGVLEVRRRPSLTRVMPPRAAGVSLRAGGFGPLIGCLAVPGQTKEEARCGSR